MELDLRTVRNELHDVREKWYDIGIELRMDVPSLKTIDNKYNDSKDCLRELITEWLKTVHPKPSWISLIDALRRKAVNEPKLAAVLEAKCIPEGRGNYTLLSRALVAVISDFGSTIYHKLLWSCLYHYTE